MDSPLKVLNKLYRWSIRLSWLKYLNVIRCFPVHHISSILQAQIVIDSSTGRLCICYYRSRFNFFNIVQRYRKDNDIYIDLKQILNMTQKKIQAS